MLVLATFASHCGGNENSQTVIVANSLAIQTLCEEGNIPAAELLQNECEEIIACLGEECQAVNKYVFFIAKSQLSLCKGLVRFEFSRMFHGCMARPSNRLQTICFSTRGIFRAQRIFFLFVSCQTALIENSA